MPTKEHLRTKARVKPATSWAGRVPQLRPGRYSDGLPIHEVQYLCCKLMLRPNHFTSRFRINPALLILGAAGLGMLMFGPQ